MVGKTQHQRYPLFLYALFLLVLLEVAFFLFYGISRHYNYLTSINDLGCFDQAIWGMLNDSPFLNTILFSQPAHWLGFHFHPVLLLFAPLYMMLPDVIWLILAQSVALPLAALPIYGLARHVTRSDRAAFLWSVTYLVSPLMLSAASWDFHPVTLAVPFIALACLALLQGRFRLLLASCLFILLCKEHMGVMVFGFGLLWLIRRRELWPSLVLLLVGAGHSLLVFKLVMPAFSPNGGHAMLSEGLGQMSRYGWLGRSLAEVLDSVVLHPLETFYVALLVMGGWRYLVLLLLPLFALPVLGFEILLPAMGDLLANLLSANPMPRSAFAYHSVTMVPVLITAAIIGSCRLQSLAKKAAPGRLAFMALAVSLIIAWFSFPFFSLPGSFPFWAPKRVFAYHDETYSTVQGMIAPGMSVSVQANIGAHFARRQQVYAFPNKVGDVDAVVLHLASPTERLRVNDPQYISSLGHHLQMAPMDYLDSVRDVLHSRAYQSIFWQAPWLVLVKEGQASGSIEEMMKAIDRLELEWRSSADMQNDR